MPPVVMHKKNVGSRKALPFATSQFIVKKYDKLTTAEQIEITFVFPIETGFVSTSTFHLNDLIQTITKKVLNIKNNFIRFFVFQLVWHIFLYKKTKNKKKSQNKKKNGNI